MWNKWFILILLVVFFIIRTKKEHFSGEEVNKITIQPISYNTSWSKYVITYKNQDKIKTISTNAYSNYTYDNFNKIIEDEMKFEQSDNNPDLYINFELIDNVYTVKSIRAENNQEDEWIDLILDQEIELLEEINYILSNESDDKDDYIISSLIVQPMSLKTEWKKYIIIDRNTDKMLFSESNENYIYNKFNENLNNEIKFDHEGPDIFITFDKISDKYIIKNIRFAEDKIDPWYDILSNKEIFLFNNKEYIVDSNEKLSTKFSIQSMSFESYWKKYVITNNETGETLFSEQNNLYTYENFNTNIANKIKFEQSGNSPDLYITFKYIDNILIIEDVEVEDNKTDKWFDDLIDAEIELLADTEYKLPEKQIEDDISEPNVDNENYLSYTIEAKYYSGYYKYELIYNKDNILRSGYSMEYSYNNFDKLAKNNTVIKFKQSNNKPDVNITFGYNNKYYIKSIEVEDNDPIKDILLNAEIKIIKTINSGYRDESVNKFGDYIEPVGSIISDIFDNAIEYDFKEGEVSGIERCYNECNGNCLEYGLTGFAWCFKDQE